MQKGAKACPGIKVNRKRASNVLVLPFILAGLFWAMNVQGQNIDLVKVDLHFQQASLQQSLLTLQKKSGVRISFVDQLLDKENKKVTFDARQVSVRDALVKILSNTGLSYRLEKDYVIIDVKPVSGRKKEPGRIMGRIIDEEDGQPVTAATIRIGDNSTVTNLDGSFSFSLPQGSYTATISCIGYGAKEVSEIEVRDNQLFELNITLKRQKGNLSAVVVKASAGRESVASLYTRQKNAAGITDGISAEQIGRTPDKNVGETLKRISGVSTMDNKYVIVRGLGERYNGAVLNGQLMPSTELNRKNFNYDIIPTGMVENITVIKTVTPDRSAEFGGGLVDINTIEIPDRNFFKLSAGASYNDKTIGKPFLSMKLEGREYLGSVSKHRYLFGTLDWKTGNDAKRYFEEHGNDLSLVNNNWGITSMMPQPSQNYQLSLGRVIKTEGGGEWGITAAANYRNTLNRLDVRTGRDGWSSTTSDDAAGHPLLGAEGQRYDFTTNLTGMAGLGYRKGNHRISLQTLYLRSLNQQLTLIYNGASTQGNWGMYDVATQTSLWQNQLKGEHLLNKKGMKLDWSASYTWLDKQRPDNHILITIVQPGALKPDNNQVNIFSAGGPNGYNRWWSRALEKNYNWEANLSVPFTVAGHKQLFKTGYAGWSKDRFFFVLNGITFSRTGRPEVNDFYLPLTVAFDPTNVTNVVFSQWGDSMHKQASLHAGYLMLDNRVGKRWRLVWGVRAEYTAMGKINAYLDHVEAAGNDMSQWRIRENDLKFFPSANLTYSLTPRMNLRLAYARSIIRPDMRELAYFHEYDYELGGEYGGAAVVSTMLDNYDFRYEWYPAPGDIVSVTGFYKDIEYPMEVFAQENRLFELKNSKEAKNYGVEMEVRKSLGFTHLPVIRNLTLYGNFTYLDARVRPMYVRAVSDTEVPGRTIPTEELYDWEKRPQAGASNYILNAGVYYDSKFFSASVVYNVITNRLVRLTESHGAQSTSYVSFYEQPARNLDAQVVVRLPKQQLEVKLNASNLLDSYAVLYNNNDVADAEGNLTKQQAKYKADADLVNYRWASGRTYSITVSYTLSKK